ncbi:MAG: hypothetical protein CL608_17915 [Anaerolineaceae bacterium]|nr:hypothetical protein [Anaerolineaceae bacterium]
MSKRALVIGSDRDYCYVIKEFLELRELYTTVVLNYKDGLDRLFYEKPDLAVLELIDQELSPALLGSLQSSNDFETFDFASGGAPPPGRKPILIFDDKSSLTSLFDFIKKNYSEKSPAKGPANTENEGDMGSTFFPCILADLYEKKKTGLLSIKSNSNLDVYFTGGVPTFAEGGDVETAIGRILLDRGIIDRESYDKAIDISANTDQKFGEILFSMGITSPHELSTYLELQIEEKILRGFYYIQGRYEFREGPNSPDSAVSYQLSLPRLVYEGIKRHVDVDDLVDRNPVIEVKPRLKSEVNSLGLKPKELRFVQLLKPRAHLKEVLESSRLEKDETLKLLYFLSLFRLLSIPGLAVDRVGRASIEKRISEMEPERDSAAVADIAAEQASDDAPGAEESPVTSLEIVEEEAEEKVWEIEMDEDIGDMDDFARSLEESIQESGDSELVTEDNQEELSLETELGPTEAEPEHSPDEISEIEIGETRETSEIPEIEEDPVSGIGNLLIDTPDTAGEASGESTGDWKPFQNDESPMPWEAGHEEVPIEPISIESGAEETGEIFEIELESSDNEAEVAAEEAKEADFSAPPQSESATSEFSAGAGENDAEELSLEVESGTSEEETELSPDETSEIGINETTETSETPEIVEEQKEEKVWEIDFSSFDEPEKSGSEEELETDEAGFKSEFHFEQDEPEASPAEPEAEYAAPAGEPADAGDPNPFQSSVGPETEPELVLDLDRDTNRDESEKAEEEKPDDASFEHSWGAAGNNSGDAFIDRVNGFYEGLEAKDHYEVLGVGKGSSNEQIRDAYYKLVKNYHPDVNPGADHDTRVKAEEIFTRITSAYETLSQNDKREEYDSQEELADLKNQAKYIYEAEMAFKKGITLLIQRNYAEAEKNIREAVTMNPEEAAYVGAHGWTRYLAAENKSSVLAESIKTLEQAIKMNGKIAENQYYLGSIYKNQNDLKNAEKCFQKAIEIEPDYIEAKRELRLINTRKMNARNDKKPEKSFWSSLFKR